MASSTCIKCSSHSFETREVTPNGSAFKLIFIQCSSCGGVVGVIDYFNIGHLLQQQNVVLQRIADRLGVDSTV